MQRHLSPWREMAKMRERDNRVLYAQVVTLLPFISWILSVALLVVIMLGGGFDMGRLTPSLGWRTVAGLSLTVLYGVAGWRIGELDARGGMLAIALFAIRIGTALFSGHALSYAALYSLVGIALVLRAAEPLKLRLGWRGARVT